MQSHLHVMMHQPGKEKRSQAKINQKQVVFTALGPRLVEYLDPAKRTERVND